MIAGADFTEFYESKRWVFPKFKLVLALVSVYNILQSHICPHHGMAEQRAAVQLSLVGSASGYIS